MGWHESYLGNEMPGSGFAGDSLSNGRSFRSLNIPDEFKRQALVIEVDISINSERVIRTLEQIIEWRGTPESFRLDNGPEFISGRMEAWAEDICFFITAISVELCH